MRNLCFVERLINLRILEIDHQLQRKKGLVQLGLQQLLQWALVEVLLWQQWLHPIHLNDERRRVKGELEELNTAPGFATPFRSDFAKGTSSHSAPGFGFPK